MSSLQSESEVSVAAAAERCHMGIGSFRAMINAGQGPAFIKISARKTFFRVADLESWLESRRVDSAGA